MRSPSRNIEFLNQTYTLKRKTKAIHCNTGKHKSLKIYLSFIPTLLFDSLLEMQPRLGPDLAFLHDFVLFCFFYRASLWSDILRSDIFRVNGLLISYSGFFAYNEKLQSLKLFCFNFYLFLHYYFKELGVLIPNI